MSGRGETPNSKLKIPAHPDAGAIARRAVSRWMRGDPRLEDSLLAVTELVNNAVLHGGLGEDEDLTVEMRASDGGVRLTVRHTGGPFDVDEPARWSRDPEASRGLAIIEQIADRWGIDSDGGEVTAWFEVGRRLGRDRG